MRFPYNSNTIDPICNPSNHNLQQFPNTISFADLNMGYGQVGYYWNGNWTNQYSSGQTRAFSYALKKRNYIDFCQTAVNGNSLSGGWVKAKVIKKGGDDIRPNIISGSKPWPDNGVVKDANIKVIRSGNRNLLGETIQQYASLASPIDGAGNLKSNIVNTAYPASTSSYFSGLLAATATSFETETSVSPDIHTDYYNPFVTGEWGNFKSKDTREVYKNREYQNLTIKSDKERGTFALPYLAWVFSTQAQGNFFGAPKSMQTVNNYPWRVLNKALSYSPWGANLEAENAVGNKSANIMGYSNRLPVATVSNSSYTNAMVENFEDYREGLISGPMNFVPNNLRKTILQQLNNNLQSTYFDIISTDKHSGKSCLKVNAATAVNFDIELPASYTTLKDFYLENGQEYIFTYWQKATNTIAPINGGVQLNIPNVTITPAKKKTPIIDGWVLYEAKISLPNYSSSLFPLSATLTLASNSIIDDLRIFPSKGNMKSYVYNPSNHRLMAVLDENNMSTYFEYDGQGKLIRIKKETEKGVLTLKESRESLKNYLKTIGDANGSIQLSNEYLPTQ